MNRKYLVPLASLGVLIPLDQITKYWVDASMRLHESIPVIAGFFNITHVRNPGAAFGLLADMSPQFRAIFFVAVTLAAVIMIFYCIWKSKQEESLLVISLSLILAGAVGNLIDRVRLGEVIDFFDVYVGNYHWPAFNIADAAISVGAVILFFELLRPGKSKDTITKGT